MKEGQLAMFPIDIAGSIICSINKETMMNTIAHSYGPGGYGEGGPLQSFDFMRPYLTMILNVIGIEEVTSVAVDATTADATTADAAMVAAIAEIECHFTDAGAV
jgi:FMN-dependent NADH-azoreductase